MAAKSVFEQNLTLFACLHLSGDVYPEMDRFSGQHGSFRVYGATHDTDYGFVLEIPTNNATLDITVVGRTITASLASVGATATTTTAQLVSALNDPIAYPAIDGVVDRAMLVNFAGVNAGTAIPSAGFTSGFAYGALSGPNFDHTGYKECLVVFDVGFIEYGASVTLYLTHSDDEEGAREDIAVSLPALTRASSFLPFFGLLRFDHGAVNFKRFLSARAVITGADSAARTEVAVSFLSAGRQYLDDVGAQALAFIL